MTTMHEVEFVRRVQLNPWDGGKQAKRYVLIGARGAVQFFYFSGSTEFADGELAPFDPGVQAILTRDLGIDLGYHSWKPIREWQKEEGDDDEFFTASIECEWSPTGRCYYDGSGLHADDVLREFNRRGRDEEWLWGYLRDHYHETFYS